MISYFANTFLRDSATLIIALYFLRFIYIKKQKSNTSTDGKLKQMFEKYLVVNAVLFVPLVISYYLSPLSLKDQYIRKAARASRKFG